jgi:hypothetical protein
MKMSIHVELKEVPGRGIPAFVVTNNQGGLRREVRGSCDAVVKELVDTPQSLLKRFDNRCVAVLKNFFISGPPNVVCDC